MIGHSSRQSPLESRHQADHAHFLTGFSFLNISICFTPSVWPHQACVCVASRVQRWCRGEDKSIDRLCAGACVVPLPIGRVPVRPSLQTGASACTRASVHLRVAPEESNCLYGNLISFYYQDGWCRRRSRVANLSLWVCVIFHARLPFLPSLPPPPPAPPPPAPPAPQRGGAGPLLAAAAALDGSNGHVCGWSLGRRKRREITWNIFHAFIFTLLFSPALHHLHRSDMSNLNKSKKDKEILAEYESQVKGKMMAFILLNDAVTPTFSYLCTRM